MIKRTIKTVTEEFDEQGRLRWRTTDDIVEEETLDEEEDFAELKEETIEVPVCCTFEQNCAVEQACSVNESGIKYQDYACCDCEEACCCACEPEDVAVHIYVHTDGTVANG